MAKPITQAKRARVLPVATVALALLTAIVGLWIAIFLFAEFCMRC